MTLHKKAFVTSPGDLVKGLIIGLILGIVFMFLNSKMGWVAFLSGCAVA